MTAMKVTQAVIKEDFKEVTVCYRLFCIEIARLISNTSQFPLVDEAF